MINQKEIPWQKYYHEIKRYLEKDVITYYFKKDGPPMRNVSYRKENLYDARENLVYSKSNYDGETHWWEYNDDNNMVEYSNSFGDKEKYKYDYQDREIYAYLRKDDKITEYYFKYSETGERIKITKKQYKTRYKELLQ